MPPTTSCSRASFEHAARALATLAAFNARAPLANQRPAQPWLIPVISGVVVAAAALAILLWPRDDPPPPAAFSSAAGAPLAIGNDTVSQRFLAARSQLLDGDYPGAAATFAALAGSADIADTGPTWGGHTSMQGSPSSCPGTPGQHSQPWPLAGSR